MNGRNKVLVDAASNYVVYGLQLLLSLVAIPLYLQTYGEVVYGLYVLTIGLASSLLFLEFGSGRAMLRYVAEHLSEPDEEKYLSALKTCMLMTGISALVVATVFVIGGTFLETFIKVEPESREIAIQLFYMTAAYAAVLTISRLPQGMLQGASIFYERNVLAWVQLVLRVIILALVYYYSISILYVVLGEIVIQVINLGLDVYVLAKKGERLVVRSVLKQLPRANMSKGVFQYAGSTFGMSTIAFFSQNADQLLIAMILDVKFVAIYAILIKPYAIVKSLLSKAYSVIQAKYVVVNAKYGASGLYDFVSSSGKGLGTLVCVLTFGLGLLLPYLFPLWLGTDAYNEYIIFAQLLLGFGGIRAFTTTAYQALYITGYTKQLISLEAILVGINLLVSLALVYTIGFYGVIIGTCVQLGLISPFMIYTVPKVHNNSSAAMHSLIKYYVTAIVALGGLTYLAYTYASAITLTDAFGVGYLLAIFTIGGILLYRVSYPRIKVMLNMLGD